MPIKNRWKTMDTVIWLKQATAEEFSYSAMKRINLESFISWFFNKVALNAFSQLISDKKLKNMHKRILIIKKQSKTEERLQN